MAKLLMRDTISTALELKDWLNCLDDNGYDLDTVYLRVEKDVSLVLSNLSDGSKSYDIEIHDTPFKISKYSWTEKDQAEKNA